MPPHFPLSIFSSPAPSLVYGALVAACHCQHVGKVRRDANARACEAPGHA